MKAAAAKRKNYKRFSTLFYLGSILFWIGLWQLAAVRLSKELFLPAPAKVCRVLWKDLFPSREFWFSIRISLLHIGTGFLAGALAGTGLAALSFLCRPIRVLLWFPIKIIKSVPVASFVILVLLWIPSSGLSVVIPFLMVLPVLYIHTLAGLEHTDQRLLEMAQIFRLSRWKKALQIYLPQVLPQIGSACSLAIGMAWKSGIAAEIIGLSKDTMGNALYQAKIYLMTPELFAWTIVIVGLSIACEWGMKGLVRLLERI